MGQALRLDFAKMEGAGNDFIVATWPDTMPLPEAQVIRSLADRRLGVGFDQLLLVQPPRSAGADASYHIHNADGESVEQCGNGARCVARFVAQRGSKRELVLDSPAGPVAARIEDGGQVTVSLGEPNFAPSAVGFSNITEQLRYELATSRGAIEVGAVSMGNPHLVTIVDNVSCAEVGILGPELSTHEQLQAGANVGFMEIEGRSRIRLRVFERGVGETLACGTGAAAAAALGIRWGLLESPVTVALPGGELAVDWSGPGHELGLRGPTREVFRGTIDL